MPPSARFAWLPLLLLPTAPVSAQAPRVPLERPQVRLVASDPPGLEAPAPDALEPLQLNADGGAVPILDVELPDAAPLPDPARFAPGERGDVLLAPASGDPSFLSFSAGRYYPPADERLDPQLAAQVNLAPEDGRPAPTSYGYVMLAGRITPARISALEALGCRVLGSRPHNCLIAALRPEALAALAFHPDVRWVGAARDWQKIGPSLAGRLEAELAGTLLVWASLFETDVNPATERVRYGEVVATGPAPLLSSPENPDPRPERIRTHGWQERALAALGAEVLEYSERNPAFLLRLDSAAVPLIAGLDFVQVVDLAGGSTPAHDESTPMIHADYGRSFYSGGTNQVAIVGEVDSGIYQPHLDLNHVNGIGWDPGGGTDPWTDWCQHGSHVAGTIVGSGDVDPGHTGNAPGLGWGGTGRLFNVKMFDSGCNWNGTTMQQAIALMRLPAASTPKPHAINNSHGCPVGPQNCGGPFDGTDQDAIDLDSAVWQDDQLWIFAAGNEGPNALTIRKEGSAKNVLTVGNVIDFRQGNQDPGEISTDSSRGPTKDGRWKPNLCAPGHSITSVLSQTASGYTQKSGTSMATPHVTGVAAELVDAYAFLRYAPARLSSLLMATGLTRNDVQIGQASELHLRQYGTGRIDAMRALHSTSQFGWTNWGFTLNTGQATFADFTVAPGATRLIVCMHYVEPPAAVNSGKALVSDFDLYLDQEPIDPGLNTGDWFAHQSAVDNTEIRILNGPQVGQWRWKIWPQATSAAAKFGLTVSVIYGDTTPDGSLVLSVDKAYAKPGQPFQLDATASNPAYIASAVYLDVTASGLPALSKSSTTLIDGKVTTLLDNAAQGWDVLLGNIRPATSRKASWTASWASEGWKNWTVEARSDNWVDKFASLTLGVDGTPPGAPYNFASMTHFVSTWSSQPDVTIVWTEPPDNLSGIEGYGWSATLGAPGTPPPVQTLSSATLLTASLGTSSLGQYLNVRGVDKAVNWGPAGSMGPFLIDLVPPVPGGTLVSSTHSSGVLSCNTSVSMFWTAATDLHSGVGGYVGLWDFSPSTAPSGPANIAAGAQTFSATLPSSASPQWFHLRPVDVAGNLGATKHAGPYLINAFPVTTYCTAKVTSNGCLPAIAGFGSPSVSGGAFRANATQVINNKPGLLMWSLTQAATPFQGGFLCLAAPVIRTAGQNSAGNPPPDDCSGSYSFQWTTGYIQSQGLVAGQAVSCQYWARDLGDAFGSSLSNGLSFTLCP